ncbi:class I SAM-dependent methyltransferase [Bacillaceae bacterium SIJ1]|uniref:class I SAM-dependent methyltransferase n=1 Tax=Litoribacterium kuwaitense TaxID=1398745 RepID=UPI0013ECC845|nr:class I SAM-dependent methyltransferase [Litoribacterium kuwaitense]NGP46811.1 class I SAM-dependent methyltransferase [Litoribacterium kuwaitense]
MFSYYGKLSTELYELTKPVGHSVRGDIEYYTERLAGTKGKVLEAGVGSGRFLVPLLEKGFDVDGIDYSPEMLAACRKNCEDRGMSPSVYEGDLTQFSLPSTYEAIIIPTGSFALIESLEGAKKALQCFYDHLTPGGRVIIDLEIPGHFRQGTISKATFPSSDDEGILLEDTHVEINWVEQYTLSHLKYEKWRKGELIASELQKFVLRWYGIEEFTLLLEKIGFSQITCSAEYSYGKQPTKETEWVTFEAVR